MSLYSFKEIDMVDTCFCHFSTNLNTVRLINKDDRLCKLLPESIMRGGGGCYIMFTLLKSEIWGPPGHW